MDSMDSMDSMESMESMQSMESMESMEAMESMESMEFFIASLIALLSREKHASTNVVPAWHCAHYCEGEPTTCSKKSRRFVHTTVADVISASSAPDGASMA